MTSDADTTGSPAPSRRRPLALSPSRVGDYRQCPLLYRLRAIDRLEEPSTLAQVKGTLVHSVLEELHGLPREDRTYPAAVKMLKPHWAAMTAKDEQLHELVPESDYMDFLVASRDLVKGYFMMENPSGFDAESVEKFVDTTLPNGVPVRGFIDRVDVAPNGAVRVVDYKTGKKPIPRFSAQAMFQMRFYALVWWRLFDHIPEQLRLMYLKVKDDMVLSPTPSELNYVEKDLGRIWSQIGNDARSGNFAPKTSKLCGWCSFQSMCPAFNGTPPEYPGVPAEFA
ncbi:MAG TPA: RecB family exonuclease [Candidatus Corynebacterium avicola]|uniref:RecB family exonuclease n=1 Tax=Candidatus Corynebacterium avicola TaxID=2838527 RepID=A0A9D1RPP2_9CORY|nr:RecB family exonuclease [Candidatus Corynebacterium avicola]